MIEHRHHSLKMNEKSPMFKTKRCPSADQIKNTATTATEHQDKNNEKQEKGNKAVQLRSAPQCYLRPFLLFIGARRRGNPTLLPPKLGEDQKLTDAARPHGSALLPVLRARSTLMLLRLELEKEKKEKRRQNEVLSRRRTAKSTDQLYIQDEYDETHYALRRESGCEIPEHIKANRKRNLI